MLQGCKLLEKNKCKFIVIPCNTAHYWFDDLQKKINIPIINMPKEVFKFTKKNCKKNSKVGLLATEGTLKTGVYDKIFNKDYHLLNPSQTLQKKSVNKAIKFVKMGNSESVLFCSFNCACSYNLSLNDTEIDERYRLLKLLYYKINS